MKKTSIHNKLLFGMIFFIATILAVGSTALYLSFRKAYYEQVDRDLGNYATLLATEIEINNGYLVNEWLQDVRNDPIRTKRDLIQSWNLNDGTTLRAPALNGKDLPRFKRRDGRYAFRNIILPDGKPGRAVGLEVQPKVEHEATEDTGNDAPGPYTGATAPRHILVIANNVENIEASLARLRWILLLTGIAVVIVSALVTRNIIRSCLFPISELGDQVARRGVEDLDKEFLIAPDFPDELKGLVSQYNHLFKKISRVRVRERDFSAHAAHELRTPLAGIILTLEQALHRSRSPDYYQECLTETLKISRSMHGMTERLLYFSRLQNDTFSMQFEQVPLHKHLDTAWQTHSAKAAARGLSAVWELADHPPAIRADPHLLEILLNNLVNNTVAYALPDSPVHIRTTAGSQGMILSITNRSKTLDKENMRRIFEPFYRKDQARDVNEHHSGIGLALCREIARSMGAAISADFDPETHTFTVCIEFAAPGEA